MPGEETQTVRCCLDGLLTASQLSKFELGQSMLSANKLILAIQGINVTFDEFDTS